MLRAEQCEYVIELQIPQGESTMGLGNGQPAGGVTDVDRLPLELYWLRAPRAWTEDMRALDHEGRGAWPALVALANTKLDFVRTTRLDRTLQRLMGEVPPEGLPTKPVRLAVLSSSTISQLLPAIRVAGLRRNLWVSLYAGAFGQYRQELLDPQSQLHKFQPDTVLFSFDAFHLMNRVDVAASTAEGNAALDAILNDLQDSWRIAQEEFGCSVLQQTIMPVFPTLLGNNEHRLGGSRQRLVMLLNAKLREVSENPGVELVALDARVAEDGVHVWHDPSLWHRAKQEVSPVAAPIYGELVARILAAKQGRSYKCLVLDLDNTLWGGVVGDDGLSGIVLGQGSPRGEAFVSFQCYARDLANRGIILAACSKNEEANAFEAFDNHPDMVLSRGHFSAFVANWDDKSKNIQIIADQLNIGLDTVVFVDDNPFERDLVRSELPMVAVPEIPEEPALIERCLADAGYFEGLCVTAEDRQRTLHYQSNVERKSLQVKSADIVSYLRDLDMQLICQRFDKMNMQRIVQLINKTNQFNLTTRRYSESEICTIMADDSSVCLHFRLLDRYGDNGIIAIVIGRLLDHETLEIDSWLMSCRVLGRDVEKAILNVIAAEGRRLGTRRLRGQYRPTPKNGMVREHYARLGFSLEKVGPNDITEWSLALQDFRCMEAPITLY